MGTAVVTGTARGIGLEACRRLSAAGFRTVLTARDREWAEAVAAALVMEGWDVVGRVLDVADAASVERFAAELGPLGDDLEVLVCNAAAPVDGPGPASTADLDAARRAFEENLFGTWRVVQALLPVLRRSGRGRIVVVSGGAGPGDGPPGPTARRPTAATDGIATAAVDALVAGLATELAGTGVLVDAVRPGDAATFPGTGLVGARPTAGGAAGSRLRAGGGGGGGST